MLILSRKGLIIMSGDKLQVLQVLKSNNTYESAEYTTCWTDIDESYQKLEEIG